MNEQTDWEYVMKFCIISYKKRACCGYDNHY